MQIKAYTYIHSTYDMWDMSGGYIGFCSEWPSFFARGHRLEIVHEHFSLDCSRRYWIVLLRVAFTWNSLPDDVVAVEILSFSFFFQKNHFI